MIIRNYKSVIKIVPKVIRPIIGLIIFFLIWYYSATFLLPNNSAFPVPFKVYNALIEMLSTGELQQDIISSLKRIFIGFLIAITSALFFGIAAARYSKSYSYIKITMELLSSIPPIAWTPLSILWFGIGDVPAYFIVSLGAFFPMFTSIYSGITKVDNELIDAAKTLGASKTKIVRSVILPSALPYVITGIKTGIGVAWFNVIAAELIGVKSGLGYKIQLYRTLLLSENVIAIMLVIGLLGYLMTRLVFIGGNMIAPWSIQDDSKQFWINSQRGLKKFGRKVKRVFFRFRPDTLIKTYSPVFTNPENSSNEFLLSVNNISKSFDRKSYHNSFNVIENIKFDIKEGEIFTIIGPNGSGKTTLIKIIAGLIHPNTGEIIFNKLLVFAPSKERTIVFQNFALFPWKTCEGNISFAIESCSKNDKKGKQFVKQSSYEYLLEANLDEFMDVYPAELSGGMKQRLALARALAVSPRLILMDEPFASFDPLVREKSQETILELIQNKSTTILLVTHDINEAVFMSDKILVLSKRPGKMKKFIDVDLPYPRTSETRKTIQFHKKTTEIWELLRSE